MDIIKSEHDKRSYRLITLDNGLRAVLVHTPKESGQEKGAEKVVNKSPAAASKSSHIFSPKLNVKKKLMVFKNSHLKPSVKNSAKVKGKKISVSKNEVMPMTTSPVDKSSDAMAIDEEDDEDYSDIESADDESMATTDESSDDEDDENEKLATLALCIGVGSFLDPEEVPGLAHLTEHMVFMGSSKYPKENAFDEFVSKHGGYSNAETENEQTLFILEIRNKYFRKAMEMLAYFFIEPLMLRDSLDREIQAVDSEFTLKVPDDEVRLSLLLTSLAKPGHPMGKFVWGNMASLKSKPQETGVDVYQHLHQFCREFYVAQLMTLAIQSQDDLDTQEKLVRSSFSKIPSSKIPRPMFGSHGLPFQVENFACLYQVQAVRQIHKLILTWSLPPLQQHYKAKPLDIIAEAVSHEGRGSLLSHFRERAWAYSLEAGNDETSFSQNSTHSIFEVCIVLSEEGLKHIYEIIAMILVYIKMLCTSDLHPIFLECQINEYNNFIWEKENLTTDYVELLASNLLNYEPQHCITADLLYFEYDAKLIDRCLEHLCSNNFNIIIQSSSFLTENLPLREPYSQTAFNCQGIPLEWLEYWKGLDMADYPFLFLPPPNPFIPSEFSISAPDLQFTQFPVKIFEDDFGSVWYKKDFKFLKPKAYICYHLISPLLRKSSKESYLMDLLVLWIDQMLRLECYAAYQAGFSFSVNHLTAVGMEILVSGFNHKIASVLKAIVCQLTTLQVKQDIFNSLKVKLQRDYKNRLLRNSDLCKIILGKLLDQDRWSVLECLSNDATLEEFQNFKKEFLCSIRIQCLFQGNMTSAQVLEMHRMVRTELGCQPLPLNSVPLLRDWKVAAGEKVLQVASLNKQDPNSLVTFYCQLGSDNLRNRCLLNFLMVIMEEPLFDQLRTKEQLGYFVSCRTSCVHKAIGFIIRVHSPSNKFSCTHLHERIKAFLKDFFDKLYKQTLEEFKEDADNFAGQLRAEDIQLDDETDNNWSEIISGCLMFDRKEACIRLMEEELTIDAFHDWLHQFLDSPAILSVQVVGSLEKEAVQFTTMRPLEERIRNFELCTMHPGTFSADVYISDINKFAQGMPLLHSTLVY